MNQRRIKKKFLQTTRRLLSITRVKVFRNVTSNISAFLNVEPRLKQMQLSHLLIDGWLFYTCKCLEFCTFSDFEIQIVLWVLVMLKENWGEKITQMFENFFNFFGLRENQECSLQTVFKSLQLYLRSKRSSWQIGQMTIWTECISSNAEEHHL